MATETVTEKTVKNTNVTAEVIKIYRDKETRIIHRPGETLELTRARFKELSTLGYVRKA